MNFYLSCLLAFPKTKNGILGFWDFGILGFWEFGTFYFSLNSANEGVKGTVSRSRRVSPGSWVQMQQRCWATISRKRPF